MQHIVSYLYQLDNELYRSVHIIIHFLCTNCLFLKQTAYKSTVRTIVRHKFLIKTISLK